MINPVILHISFLVVLVYNACITARANLALVLKGDVGGVEVIPRLYLQLHVVDDVLELMD